MEENGKTVFATAVFPAVVSMCVTQMNCLSAGMTGNCWGPRPVGGPLENWKKFYSSCNKKIAVEDVTSLNRFCHNFLSSFVTDR